MYRSDLNSKDKGGALVAVVLIHVGLLFMLLHLSGKIDLGDPQSVLKTFDVTRPPPPPPVPPPAQQADRAKPKEREGGSSPENVRSQATPVRAPEPRVEPLLPNPVVVTETPRSGSHSTQGAASVAGPGTGSGGVGTGTGSGLGGNGPGGGGGGGAAIPAALVRGITSGDYPTAIRQSWPRGAAIFLRLRIEANGRPSRCDVMRGYGNPSADQWTCTLIMQRGLFRPARDSAGRPVAAWFGYRQSDRDR